MVRDFDSMATGKGLRGHMGTRADMDKDGYDAETPFSGIDGGEESDLPTVIWII